MAGSAPISLSVGWAPPATGCWAWGSGPPASGPPTGGPPAGGPPAGSPPAAGMGNVLLMIVFIRPVRELNAPAPLGPAGGGVTGAGGGCVAAVGTVPIEVVVMVAILAIVNDWTCETSSSILGLSVFS
jgi:hypothetical protein